MTVLSQYHCRRLTPLLAGLCLIAGLCASARAESQRFDDITVIVEPAMISHAFTNHGYIEYRFRVTNMSPDQNHAVEIILPRNSWGHSRHHVEHVRRAAVVAPRSSAMISLFQPPLPMDGNGVEIFIDGRRQQDVILDVPTVEHISQSWRHNRGLSVLCGREAWNGDIFDEFADAHGHRDDSVVRSELDTTAWPTQWLSYSAFDGVILAAEEFNKAPGAVRDALVRYAEAGGCLVIAGSWQPPASWLRHSASQAESPVGLISQWYPGFGRCLLISDIDEMEQDAWQTVALACAETDNPFEHPDSVESANESFPVVEELGVPVRGLFIVMLLFAIAIGPVNLLLVSRGRRRMWLLWTVPLMSAATCLVVFAYASFAEGWSGHGRTALLTILDESTQRATSVGWTAFYCPLTPGEGLHFATDTELTPQVGQNYYGHGGRPRTVNWTVDQHLASGWIIARAPAHFRVRRSQSMQRQRLPMGIDEDGRAYATNGLGAPIRQLTVADADGRVFQADNIAPGARALLIARPDAALPDHQSDRQRSIYTSDWLGSIRRAGTDPTRFLEPGTYVAELDGAPFLDSGLADLRDHKKKNIVIGLIEQPIPLAPAP